MATRKTAKKTPSKSSSKKGNASLMGKIIRSIFKLFLWGFGLSLFFVVLFKFVPVFYTPLMAIRAIENTQAEKEVYLNHDWVPMEEISVNLQKAVIASEDGNFLRHNGFDFKALANAYESNQKGKKLKGGSTISQQTAKNVFLWQGRSYLRKGLEAYFTVLIELIWGKERIMEVYLNSIEMGNGIYGAQAASEYWYRKDAKDLTKYEAAGIAAILPNPRKFKAINSSSYTNRRKDKIVRVMRHIGKIDYDKKPE
ncbi:monofunctional biosynthetic peptidoglycan transglycosylase [Flavobacterium sp. SM15]|uniref:monofunctional biosynthetic peptidoglycan transglycosylase n=1 Tax=Flavobacterium sp. SM15 TaxID=2908005 RepID=UPI001EDBB950|nr:monofunctional biosynthetic peptidoglycan transglycosylase [Flavobacterium sp. SM15]MCG2610188.1 monofunctional biosynthetic peptidoglycan transglycosylase [Flavobacterium sp. SM15]